MTSRAITLAWSPLATPPALAVALRALARRYPIVEAGRGDLDLRFQHNLDATGVIIERRDGAAYVQYADVASALRGVGALLADLPGPDRWIEKRAPRQLGIMLDVSRGAVITPDHFKRWLDRLALLGFNTAMLYTEDVYRLPDEPCFGYARGAYTVDELRAIDDHAHALGIEMIPCIQTLGHLEQVLKWWPYADVKDTDSVLLVDDERSDELLGKMLDHWTQVFRSRRIHGGMDEAYDLGRGRFRDRFGHQASVEIFTRHLQRVKAMCDERGLELMIWSDMFFHLNSATGKHYDPDAVVPDDVAKAVPRDVKLVYWDYYKDDSRLYAQVIERHRALGFEPIVASAVTTPYRFWYDRHETLRTARPCVDACRDAGVEALLFTMWGDDGAYCDFDSALAGLTELADHVYGVDTSPAQCASRFKAVCGGNLEAHQIAAELHHLPGISTPGVLWDDPLLGIYLRSRRLAGEDTLCNAADHFASIATRLATVEDNGEAGDLHHAHRLALVLAAKAKLADDLFIAYRDRNRHLLNDVAGRIEPMCQQLDALAQSFRTLWMKRHKPFGLETIQIRLAGLIARYRELGLRLDELKRTILTTIPELDEPSPGRHGYAHYQRLATGSARL